MAAVVRAGREQGVDGRTEQCAQPPPGEWRRDPVRRTLPGGREKKAPSTCATSGACRHPMSGTAPWLRRREPAFLWGWMDDCATSSRGPCGWRICRRHGDGLHEDCRMASRGGRSLLPRAAGFIAGGALMGVLSAILRYAGFNWVNLEWFESHAAEILALVMFILIGVYMIWDTMRAKKEA